MYIRKDLIGNGLYLVIDITKDVNYVHSTNLEWTQINSQNVALGDFFYDNQIISTHDTEKYNQIVAPILHQIEEDYKQQNAIVAPTRQEVVEEDTNVIEYVAPTTNRGTIPNPQAKPISEIPGVEKDIKHYNMYKLIKEKVDAAKTRLQNNTGVTIDTENKKITFNPILTFTDGETQENAYYHEANVSEYISYLSDHSDEIGIFLQQVRDLVSESGGPILD